MGRENRNRRERMEIVELHPAAITCCPHCEEEGVARIPVTSDGDFLVPVRLHCCGCGREYLTDAEQYREMIRRAVMG